MDRAVETYKGICGSDIGRAEEATGMVVDRGTSQIVQIIRGEAIVCSRVRIALHTV
jgi:hypothetical protein